MVSMLPQLTHPTDAELRRLALLPPGEYLTMYAPADCDADALLACMRDAARSFAGGGSRYLLDAVAQHVHSSMLQLTGLVLDATPAFACIARIEGSAMDDVWTCVPYAVDIRVTVAELPDLQLLAHAMTLAEACSSLECPSVDRAGATPLAGSTA